AAIGPIDNFATLDRVHLTRGGTRTLKQLFFLMGGNAIQMDGAWARIYQRRGEKRCTYAARKRAYTGKIPIPIPIVGRSAGHRIAPISARPRRAPALLAPHAPHPVRPQPLLYAPSIHKAPRAAQYPALQPPLRPHGSLTSLPHPQL